MRLEKTYMAIKSFFFDSYALYEIVIGGDNYLKYRGCNIILTKLNLFEVYHSLIKQGHESLAEIFLDLYSIYVIDFDNEVIKESARFKIENKKKYLSMTDCICYVISKKLSIRFLTGDKEFEHMDNVEFVK